MAATGWERRRCIEHNRCGLWVHYGCKLLEAQRFYTAPTGGALPPVFCFLGTADKEVLLLLEQHSMADATKRSFALAEKEKDINERLSRLEGALLVLRPTPSRGHPEPLVGSRWAPVGAEQLTLCPRHAQMRRVLDEKCFGVYQFCAVPPNYYDQSLEFRHVTSSAAYVLFQGHVREPVSPLRLIFFPSLSKTAPPQLWRSTAPQANVLTGGLSGPPV